jgi:hypothetical protein
MAATIAEKIYNPLEISKLFSGIPITFYQSSSQANDDDPWTVFLYIHPWWIKPNFV